MEKLTPKNFHPRFREWTYEKFRDHFAGKIPLETLNRIAAELGLKAKSTSKKLLGESSEE